MSFIDEITKRFDVKKFNKEFDSEMSIEKKNIQIKEEEKLKQMSDNENNKKDKLYKMNIFEILIQLKNNVFSMMDDIIHLNFNNFFSKDDRLFYIGLILILFGLFMSIISYLFDK